MQPFAIMSISEGQAFLRGPKHFVNIVTVCGLLGLVCFMTACQSPTYPPGSSLDAMALAAPSISGTLQEGDTIQVAFAGSTNLNTTQRIPLDGQISLQFVGKLKATGKTTAELEKDLAQVYQPQLRGAESITVTVVTSSAAVYVTGAVLRPGKIPLDRPFTVLEAIMEAGGVDSRAKLSGVTVLRVEGGQRIARKIDLKRTLEGKDSFLFYLKPADIIYVPEKVINF